MNAKDLPARPHRMRTLTLGLWCIVPVLACAQDLVEVYQKAKLQDAQYQAARKAFNASMEKVPQARAGLLPTVNVTGNGNHQLGSAAFSDAGYMDRDVRSWTWNAQISQPLFRWANWVGYQQANTILRQSGEQFAIAEQDLLLRVAQTYLDVLVATQSAAVSVAQMQAMAEQLAMAERTYSVGTGTITDVHEARAKWALSQSQNVAAQNELTVRHAEMEKMLGEPLPAVLLNSERAFNKNLPLLSPVQIEEWLASASRHNLQVKIQQTMLDMARDEVRKSDAAHLPTLDLVISRSGSYNSGSLSSPADISTLVYSNQAGLQLNIPIFSGGATHSRVRETLALQDKAQDELTLAIRNATSQVRQAFAGIVNGQAQIAALLLAVDAGKNAVESNKIGLRAGTRIMPDVLNAEAQLYSSLRDLNKARMDTALQGLKLKAAAGTLTQDDLAALDL